MVRKDTDVHGTSSLLPVTVALIDAISTGWQENMAWAKIPSKYSNPVHHKLFEGEKRSLQLLFSLHGYANGTLNISDIDNHLKIH